MTDQEKVAFLAGQVAGLRVLVHSLLEAHPAPGLLREVLECKYQTALAATTPEPVSEAYLAGLQDEAGFVMAQPSTGV